MPVIPENIINLQTDTIPQTIINIDIDDTGAIFVQLAHAQANIAMDCATTAGNYANSAQISSNNALHSAEVAQGHSEDASAAADRSEAARDAAEDLIPGVGRVGDFLQKTVDGAQWASFPEGIGTWGGIIGDIRNQTDLQEALADKITYPETGTTGQLLARTADGEGEWVDAPNSAVWGLIQGDIKNQTDLQNEFEHGVELTKAEYDALPSSKLTDDVNYWIKDGTNLPQTSVISADGVQYTNSQTVKGALDEQASAISDLNTGLTTLLKVQTVSTGTQSIERGYISATLNTPSGYTPIGIVQYEGSGTGSFYIQELRISGSSAQAYVRAISGSASSLSMSFKVLFVKTGYIS